MVHKWFFILLFTSINSHIFSIQQLSLESNVVISVFFTKILQLGAWLFLVWFLVGSDWLIKSFSRCALTLMSTRKWSWFFTLWLVRGCLFLVCSLMRTKLDSPFFRHFNHFHRCYLVLSNYWRRLWGTWGRSHWVSLHVSFTCLICINYIIVIAEVMVLAFGWYGSVEDVSCLPLPWPLRVVSSMRKVSTMPS